MNAYRKKQFFQQVLDGIERGSTVPLHLAMKHPAFVTARAEAERLMGYGLIARRDLRRDWKNFLIDCGTHPASNWEHQLQNLIEKTTDG